MLTLVVIMNGYLLVIIIRVGRGQHQVTGSVVATSVLLLGFPVHHHLPRGQARSAYE